MYNLYNFSRISWILYGYFIFKILYQLLLFLKNSHWKCKYVLIYSSSKIDINGHVYDITVIVREWKTTYLCLRIIEMFWVCFGSSNYRIMSCNWRWWSAIDVKMLLYGQNISVLQINFGMNWMDYLHFKNKGVCQLTI